MCCGGAEGEEGTGGGGQACGQADRTFGALLGGAEGAGWRDGKCADFLFCALEVKGGPLDFQGLSEEVAVVVQGLFDGAVEGQGGDFFVGGGGWGGCGFCWGFCGAAGVGGSEEGGQQQETGEWVEGTHEGASYRAAGEGQR